MPQNLENTLNQTALKHYNQFRSVITEAHIWFKIATDTVMKLKAETTVK